METKPRKRRERFGGRVYVISDGKTVKVGISSRGKCIGRFREIKKDFGFVARDRFVTDRRLDYRLIEKTAHQKLSDKWLHHEFFDVPFLDAVAIVNGIISDLDELSAWGVREGECSGVVIQVEVISDLCFHPISSEFNGRRRQRGVRGGDIGSRLFV